MFSTWLGLQVADMYAPNGVLLPTVSNEYRSTREAIVRYFVSFLKYKPQGVIDMSEVSGCAFGWIAMWVSQRLALTGSALEPCADGK